MRPLFDHQPARHHRFANALLSGFRRNNFSSAALRETISSPDALRRGQPNSRRATVQRPFLSNARCRARMPVALAADAASLAPSLVCQSPHPALGRLHSRAHERLLFVERGHCKRNRPDLPTRSVRECPAKQLAANSTHARRTPVALRSVSRQAAPCQGDTKCPVTCGCYICRLIRSAANQQSVDWKPPGSVWPPVALPVCASRSHRICDESARHIQSGRQALAAVAGRGRSTLPPARHRAGAVLGRVRPSSAVRAAHSLVAAVGLALASRHRVAAALTPPRPSSLSRFAAHL
jgi:hypothetical protein